MQSQLLLGGAGIKTLGLNRQKCEFLTNVVMQFSSDPSALFLLRRDKPTAQFTQCTFRLPSFGDVRYHANDAVNFSYIVKRSAPRLLEPNDTPAFLQEPEANFVIRRLKSW